MLQKETVSRETFELLTELMNDSKLYDFNLAGGTALPLYIGHRKSIDLDLFSTSEFIYIKIRISPKNARY